MTKVVFYRCNACGNVVVKAVDSGVSVECCGEFMEELVPQTADTGMEKHVPVVKWLDDKTLRVSVGSVEHPMVPAHYIQWVCAEFENGFQLHYLTPDDKPVVNFCCMGRLVAVYEYCNLHGLWKAEIQ